MTNNYYQKQKEEFRKEARERCQIFLKKKDTKGEKRPETDIKISLQKKKEKSPQYHRERHDNLSVEQKQNQVEC